MIERIVLSALVIIVALCGYLAAIHWHDDPHPLVVDASAACAPPVRLPNPCDTTDCRRPNTRLYV